MDTTSETNPRSTEDTSTAAFSLRDLDPETILLLVDDKISTGG